MVFWQGYNTYGSYAGYKRSIDSGSYYFRNWDQVYPNANIFDADGSITYDEPIQGFGGTCYLLATMGSMAENPELVRNMFLTQQKN